MRAQVSAALASKRSQSTINVLIACCCAGDVQRPFMRGAFAPEGARGARTPLDQHLSRLHLFLAVLVDDAIPAVI